MKSQHAVDRVTWCDEWVTAGQAIVTAARRERETSSAKQFSSNPSAKPPVNQAVRPPVNQAAKPPVNQSSTRSVARAITEYLAGSAINLFAASSNTIRYLNEATDVRAQIHASRGLAGIDGLISTATGLSLALGEQVVLVIGDVAMLHDVGGLLTPSAEEEGDVLIVVLNDDGGAIFSGLEHSQDHVAPYLERYFTVPHGRDFRDLAAAYGWGYMRVGTHDEVGNEVLGDFIADFEEVADFEKVAGSEEVAEFEKADGGPGTKRRGRRIIEVNLT